jgi:hypothetical protein
MKLTRSQIRAIASKIAHERTIKHNAEIASRRKKYIPDAQKVVDIDKQIKVLAEKKEAVLKNYSFYRYNVNTLEEYTNEMCKSKEKIKDFSKEKIEEALVIASVDAADMDALMKNYEKFLI